MFSFHKYYFILSHYIKTFLRIVLSYIAGGQDCLRCGKKCFNFPLCSDCKNIFLEESSSYQKRCECCSKPLLSEEKYCTECRELPLVPCADSVYCLFTYRLWKKNFLFTWKLKDRRSITHFFARAVFEKIQNMDKDYVIVPVPPRPGKIREKGWDQIDELSSYLKFFYGLKTVSLLKRKSRYQQKKLDREHRLLLKNQNYYLSELCTKLLKNNELPQKVILLDDVMTTGSTADSCCQLLKSAGVCKVFVMTLFIVD